MTAHPLRAAAAAAILSLAAAAPLAAAPATFTAFVDTLGLDTIEGALGGTAFSATTIELTGYGDTDDVITFGPGVFGMAFTSAELSIDGVLSAQILEPLGVQFDETGQQLTLGVVPVAAFAAASPLLGPVSWDMTTDLPPVAVGFDLIDWTVIDPTWLATDQGQLVLDFGPDGDGSAFGFVSATVESVPLPAAAPLLLAGLAGAAALRRRG